MVLTVGYDTASVTPDYQGTVDTDWYGRKIPKQAHGSKNLGCQSSSTKLIMDKTLELYDEIVDQKLLVRRSQVQSSVTERENGTYTVTLHLRDEVDSVMDLELMVATEEMAKDLADRFRKNPEQLYTALLGALYGQ